MKQEISEVFLEVIGRENAGEPLPEIHDDLILLKSGLDSLGFAILVVELETKLGFDPFSIAEDAYYPQTFGDFVSFYEKHKPT